MADRAISELIAASQVTPTDFFVLEQSGTAKKLTGQTLENWLVSFADGHGGIQSIVKKSTSGLKDTYRITLADTTTFDFVVTNGKAISSVKQTAVSGLTRTYTIAFNDGTSQTFTVTDGRAITSIEQTDENGLTRTYTISMNDGTSETFTITDGRAITDISKTATNVLTDTYTVSYNDGSSSTFTVKNGNGIKTFEKVSTVGLVDTYRITYDDGTSDDFTVTNGAKGDKGDNTYTHIKYASQEPTESSHSFGDIPDRWLGLYWGSSSEAPTDWTQYKWYEIKGEKGDTGDPAVLVNAAVEYQVSDSGTIIPSGSWSLSVPLVAQGKYLWTRTTNTFNTGSPVTSYSVSRMGLDGSGSVSSVANVSPNSEGNVPLTASDIGALPNTGGDLTGELRMNGQPISGLNPPTASDHAANMGFVNQQVRKAAPRNWLDNSDFRNPVNQRGYKGTHITDYTIDRWTFHQTSGTLSADGITLTGNLIYQYLDNIGAGKKVTGVVCLSDGTRYIESAAIPATGTATKTVFNVDYADERCFAVNLGSDNILQFIFGPGENPATVAWVALYEGEYTAETLPEYRPKGYGAELVECMRYYQCSDLIYIPYGFGTSGAKQRNTIHFYVPMRETPTVLTTLPTSTEIELLKTSKYGFYWRAPEDAADNVYITGWTASADY